MTTQLKHDVALMMAQHCVELLVNILDEIERQQAREGFYEICKAGIDYYEVHADRMHKRLRPLDN